MIRELQFGDLEQLKKIAPKDFAFPNLESGLYCSQKAMFVGDEFVGAAMLKLTSESVLILDESKSELMRANAIAEAFKIVPQELDKFGLDQTHVFVLPSDDERYAQFLIRHFNFKHATGIPLVYTR